MTTATPVARKTVTWRGLVGLAVAGDLALLFAQVGIRQDREALAVAAAMLLGAGLLRLRGGLAGLWLLCLSFANLVVWMLLAAVSNAAHGASLVNSVLPAALASVSVAGLVASVAAIASRNKPPAGGGTVLRAGLGSVAAVAAVLATVSVLGPGPTATAEGGLTVDFRNVAFRPATITAPSGQVTVHLVNSDLFWHSFTIDSPGVNMDVPMGGERTLTFFASPGTYQFYCRVPGHRQAGMVGTLTVSG